MRRYMAPLMLLVLFLAVAWPTIAQAATVNAAAPSEEALEAAVWAYEEALEAGNVEQLLAFFVEDAFTLPPGEGAVVGKEAIAEYMTGFFDDNELDREFKLISYNVSGNYATRLGEWTNVLTPAGGGTLDVEVGRCMFGYEFDGEEWKVAWQIWNYGDNLAPMLSHDGSPC